MSKPTTWIYDRPNPDLLDPKCWTNGVPEDGATIIIPAHETETFPPRWCKNTDAFEGKRIEAFICIGGGVKMPGPSIARV